MSAYLRNLLAHAEETEEPKPTVVKKVLPHWLTGIQSSRPVTYDTSELYEIEDELDKKKDISDQQSSKKCYECEEYGHIAKECPNKWKKKLGGRFKESDWACAMCGNINWDWRQHCNKCSTPKPTTGTEKRTGKGGGYNEIDEETLKRLKSKSKNKKHSKDSKDIKSVNNDPTIYITNLPDTDMSPPELINKLATLFGQIGKVQKEYRRKRSQRTFRIKLFGHSASLRYEDAHTAPFAIQWFDNTEFEGNVIRVKMRKDMNESDCNEFEGKERAEHSESETEENERADIEAEIEENEMAEELFGYTRRGKGRGRGARGRGRGRGKKSHRSRDRSRSRSRSRSRDRRDRDRGRRDRDGSDRNRARNRKTYRASKR